MKKKANKVEKIFDPVSGAGLALGDKVPTYENGSHQGHVIEEILWYLDPQGLPPMAIASCHCCGSNRATVFFANAVIVWQDEES